MRSRAADDADTITTRINELREEAKPRCPNNPGITLYNCLRSSSRCGDSCPHAKDWMGPSGEPA